MILADIGNSRIHIYEDGMVIDLEPRDAMESFGERIVHYISVNDKVRSEVAKNTYWRDISSRVVLPGSYKGMGVDRKALCMSADNGIFIDAGSALTIDKIVDGKYEGGFIFPGLHAIMQAYASISPILDIEPEWHSTVSGPCKGTSEQIVSAVKISVKTMMDSIRNGDETVYCTGGDGRIVASWIDNAVYDDTLVFKGLLKAIDKTK